MARIVAALWIDPRGPYPSLPDVDCWDMSRDARNYRGDDPVVVHPPCAPYSKIAHLDQQQEREHGILAAQMVRRNGGVLEHPAGSRLWGTVALPYPDTGKDFWGGYTIEVAQVEWGHVARKRTWLYLVGVQKSALRDPPFPGRAPTHWCSGGRTKSSRKGSPVPPGIKVTSGQQRRRTPPAFAEYLVSLARASKAPARRRAS